MWLMGIAGDEGRWLLDCPRVAEGGPASNSTTRSSDGGLT